MDSSVAPPPTQAPPAEPAPQQRVPSAVDTRSILTPEDERKYAQLLQQLPEDDPRHLRVAALWANQSVYGATERPAVPRPDASPVPALAEPPQFVQQFTSEQATQMRAQMLAYKTLSKNAPIPPNIQLAASGVNVPIAPTRIDANGAVTSAAAAQATQERLVEKVGAAFTAQQVQQQMTNRRSMLQDPLRIVDAKRLIVTNKLPLGLDTAQIVEQRDAIAKARVQHRVEELKALPSNLPSELKSKALIELKALKLVDFQRKIREEVMQSIQQSTSLEISENRSLYKRMRRGTGREARMTERLEKQQQLDREARERQRNKKQRDHLTSIVQHSRDFKEHHRTVAAKRVRLGKMVVSWHTNFEREEQRRQEKIQKDMIRYLRENDESKFIELVKQAKNARVVYLLEQTDAFLKDLTGKVLEQKKENKSVEELAAASEEASSSDAGGGKVEFYQLAHSIFEPITQQPSIMVGGQLKDYQLKGLQWMVSLYNNNLNGILADEMGLGKTIQSIALITYLMETKNHNGPFLVLAPLSTLSNWKLEFERWAPSVQKVVYSGSKNTRHHLQNTYLKSGNFNVLLTTYEFVMRDIGVLSKVKWTYIIIDEGHRIKSKSAKLTQVLASKYPAKHRLLLTGTPLQNNLPELWALLNFLLPKVFQSKQSFEDWFNAPFEKSPRELTGEKLELSEEESLLVIRRLHKVLEPFMLRRLKRDVETSLPDKVERVLKCQMSGLQTVLYRQMEESNRLAVAGEGKTRPQVYQNLIMQLRKLCNHPFLFEEIEDQINPHGLVDETVVRSSGKFELLDRILPKFKAMNHRTLLFFQSTSLMDIMEDYCKLRNYKILRLQGNTPVEERRESVNLWNAPDSEYFLFLLTTRAGGLGLNLQTASTVILFESDWNPFADLQAQDRAHRIGQKNEVRVYRIVTAKSIEEIILERAQFKLDVDAKVIQAGKFDQKTSHSERETMLKQLLQLDKDRDEVDDDVVDDEELNEILARNEEELDIYNRIDRERETAHAAAARAKRSKPLPRLMEVSELPPGITMPEKTPQNEEEELIGRGRRKTTQLRSYSEDLLTERQYLQIVENGQDVEDVLRRKAERRAKRKRDAEDDDEVGAETPPPSARATPKRPTGSPALVSMDPARAALANALLNILIGVEKVTEPATGRKLAELFLKLPPKAQYPDYYEIISKPIAFDVIRKKIKENKYPQPSDFLADVSLLFANARIYNEEGSQVYDDSRVLEATAQSLYDAACPGGVFVPPPESLKPAVVGPKKRGRPRKNPIVFTAEEPEEEPPQVDTKVINAANEDSGASESDDEDEESDAVKQTPSKAKTPAKGPMTLKLKLGGGSASPSPRSGSPASVKSKSSHTSKKKQRGKKRQRVESEEESEEASSSAEESDEVSE